MNGRMEVEVHRVAPRAGAWIETIPFREFGRFRMVAPSAGAWIETTQEEEYRISNPRACGGAGFGRAERRRAGREDFRIYNPSLGRNKKGGAKAWRGLF